MKKIIVISIVTAVVGAGLVFFLAFLPAQKKANAEIVAKESVKKELHVADSTAKAEAKNAEEWRKESIFNDEWGNERKAELDSVQTVLDSTRVILATQDSLLKAKAQFAVKPAKGQTQVATTTTSAQKLKGNPVIDDVNKTFTYVASDKLKAEIMAKCPDDYKKIEKPR